jgi:SAM-dependent methyltransferase
MLDSYQGIPAELYDANPICAARRDVRFYVDLALEMGGSVLEMGCGTGRVLLPVARALDATDSRVAGLELSESMLAQLRAKLAREPERIRSRIRIVRESMTSFDLGESFALVTAPFRAFQHLVTVEEELACLRSAHRHLRSGGRLVLDFFQTDPRRMHDSSFLQESEPSPDVTLPDGRRLRLSDRVVAFHRAAQVNDVELIYTLSHPDGRLERFVMSFPVRYFFRFEVEHLLVRAGFRLVDVFGDFDRSPLDDGSPEMIFVAER